MARVVAVSIRVAAVDAKHVDAATVIVVVAVDTVDVVMVIAVVVRVALTNFELLFSQNPSHHQICD